MFAFGKHRGRTFADVKEKEPEYVSWALDQRDPSGALAEFLDYLKTEGVTKDNRPVSPEPAEPGETAEKKLTFGKHRGRTFADMKDNEPEYVSWALSQSEPSGALADFIGYLKAEGVTKDNRPARPAPAEPAMMAENVLTFGKHKGRTFAAVKDTEPKYVLWALEQKEPSGDLADLVAYLKAVGVSENPPTALPPVELGPETLLTFGQHRGRSFGDVMRNEREYALWALEQYSKSPSTELKGFIDYLKANSYNDSFRDPKQVVVDFVQKMKERDANLTRAWALGEATVSSSP
eukprot:gnl/TRDRNA2_/TRDRNA2_89409_c0_seq2.p1 gnl/TRDRNA2_/TRDRNA2_89409_c0~~gnl/TRDRNA2_/TRDRNA2_89409_c0_seq2.p1  ORF type:complete len:292 (-),score=49.85 gnl/TRDRNA2_/TRDRNA2_89409_c0_seq2:42-917(-)